ncbi:MAG: 50S ribosomal protein L13 [Chitinophagales bacterium]
MDTLSYKTKTISAKGIERKWFIVDAEDMVLGRMCTTISRVLQGKHKAAYTANIDNGDHVIVVNAEKVKLTGDKWNQKQYITYSGYTGGQKSKTAKQVRASKPEHIIEKAVKGMLPRTKLGRQMYMKLHVFAGPSHNHEAQKPETLKF